MAPSEHRGLATKLSHCSIALARFHPMSSSSFLLGAPSADSRRRAKRSTRPFISHRSGRGACFFPSKRGCFPCRSFDWDLPEVRGASEPQRDFLWFYEVADLGSAMGKRCPIIDRGADLQSPALHTLQIKQNQKVEESFPIRHGSESPWPNDCFP